MKNFILFTVLILFVSCDEKKQKKELKVNNVDMVFSDNDFKIVRELQGEYVKKINDSLINFGMPYIYGQYLILRNQSSEKLLHIIHIPKDEYIGSFLSMGNGPGELHVAWRYFISDDENFGVYDPRLKKVVEVNLDSLILKNKYIKEYHLPLETVFSDGTFAYNDRLYFNNVAGNPNHFLYSTTMEGNDLKGYGELPLLDKRFLNLKLRIIDVFDVKMDKYKNIAAFSYSKIPQLNIFNLDNEEWIRISGPKRYIPSPLDKSFKIKQFYKNIRVTKNYIYVLYNGKDRESFNHLAQNANIIYCFSHSGQLIKKIKLDKGIFSFAVYNDLLLYGIGMDKDGEINLIKFNL